MESNGWQSGKWGGTSAAQSEPPLRGSNARLEGVLALLPEWLHIAIKQLTPSQHAELREIRLRMGRPVQLCVGVGSLFYHGGRGWLTEPLQEMQLLAGVELRDVFIAACGYSVHACEAQIEQGFLTLAGGHRVGVCGTGVHEHGRIKGMRDISSLNIRIAHEMTGCAAAVLPYVRGGTAGLLLAGPPCSGKTTVLRDLARLLSLTGRKVCIVDERGEIAACAGGMPQNEVGPCTDVIDGIGKAEGISRAVRTLAPEVIICDEIGSQEDALAIREAAGCGVTVIATLHAGSARDILRKSLMRELAELGVFEMAILLETGAQIGRTREVIKLGDGYAAKTDGVSLTGGLLRGSGNCGIGQAFGTRGTA